MVCHFDFIYWYFEDFRLRICCFRCKSIYPREWTWQTYGQGSAELGISEPPKKYFPNSKTLKYTLRNTIHFTKVKHDMAIMENHDYWSTWWIKLNPKDTVENMKCFKKFNNPKNFSICDHYPKNTDCRNSKPKNTALITVCKYAESTPWAIYVNKPRLNKDYQILTYNQDLCSHQVWCSHGQIHWSCLSKSELDQFTVRLVHVSIFFWRGRVAGSEDFACATLPNVLQ